MQKNVEGEKKKIEERQWILINLPFDRCFQLKN